MPFKKHVHESLFNSYVSVALERKSPCDNDFLRADSFSSVSHLLRQWEGAKHEDLIVPIHVPSNSISFLNFEKIPKN